MNEQTHQKLAKLAKCSFVPGTWDKRFVRNLARQPVEYELTPEQQKWVDILYYKYRRQTGAGDNDIPTGAQITHFREQELEAHKLDRWTKAATGEPEELEERQLPKIQESGK